MSGLLALSAIVTVAAWLVARQRAGLRPVALYLTVSLVADLARWPLTTTVIIPAQARLGEAPITGWARVACDVDNALFLAPHAALAALAVGVFTRRRPWPVALVWVAAVAALAIGYPLTRGAVLRQCYLAAELTTLGIMTGCYVLFWWSKRKPDIANFCTLALGAGNIAVVIGPYRLGDIFGGWYIAQAMYVTVYVVLLILQGGILWGSRKRSV